MLNENKLLKEKTVFFEITGHRTKYVLATKTYTATVHLLHLTKSSQQSCRAHRDVSSALQLHDHDTKVESRHFAIRPEPRHRQLRYQQVQDKYTVLKLSKCLLNIIKFIPNLPGDSQRYRQVDKNCANKHKP